MTSFFHLIRYRWRHLLFWFAIDDVIYCRPLSESIRTDRVREVSSDSGKDLHFQPCWGPSLKRWPSFRWSKTTSTRPTRSPTRPRSWRRCWWRSVPTIFWDSENDFWQNKIWKIDSSLWHSMTRPWTRDPKISSDSAKLDRFFPRSFIFVFRIRNFVATLGRYLSFAMFISLSIPLADIFLRMYTKEWLLP